MIVRLPFPSSPKLLISNQVKISNFLKHYRSINQSVTIFSTSITRQRKRCLMKKFNLVSVLMVSILLLSACSSSSNETAESGGGTVIVTYQNDITTLDPAIGYDWQNWSIIKALFSRLMDYEPGTTDLVPSLATEAPEISSDGMTYTFKLRSGVKFHNGRELTADDVKYSIEREVNPKTMSPGAGYYGMLKGYEEVTAGTVTTLEGVEVIDPTTVVFHLSRPDATFLHILAMNFSSIVPKEEVDKYGADFGKNPVGSGTFMFTKWDLGKELIFTKNPNYFVPGLPIIDVLKFEVGIDPTVALARLKNGEVDIIGDGIPSANYVAESNDPANKDLIVETRQLQTSYVTLNVKIKPFDNLKVRTAVNYAINKERIVQIINGRAVTASQILPPSMPGYDTAYKGFSYDIVKAKQLLAEAGFAKGFSTELWSMNTDPNPRIAQAIQQDLAEIGIKVAINSLAQANVIEAGGNGTAPMIWSGGMGWIADFPDPNGFYGIANCAGANTGGWNWTKYCNKGLDAEAIKADSMVDPAQSAKRIELWKSIFTRAMNDVPMIPVFHEKRISMKSSRLGGENKIIFPVEIPVNFDRIFIK